MEEKGLPWATANKRPGWSHRGERVGMWVWGLPGRIEPVSVARTAKTEYR